MDVVLIQLLAFVAVVLFVTSLKNAFSRSTKITEKSSKPMLFRSFENEIQAVGGFIAPAVSRMAPDQTRQIRSDIIAAAIPIEVTEIRGLQGLAAVTASCVFGVLIFLLSMNPLYALAGFVFFAFFGWVYPVTWLTGNARRRKDDMSRSLPYAIDLLTVSMQAGQDFGASLRHLVAEGLTGPLAQEFSILLRETELGKSRVEALQNMSDRIQLDEFKSLVTAVTQSTEMGASISGTLKIQAEEIRRARFHSAERQAARAPALMLIPMALFILPAVFIVIFTPVALRVIDSGIGNYLPTQ